MNEGWAAGGGLLVKSPYASKSKGEGLGWRWGGIDGVREKTGIFRGRREALSRDSHR